RLVAGVIASDQFAAERASETVDVGGPKVDTGSICGHCGDIRHEVTSGSLECAHSADSTFIPPEMREGIVWIHQASGARASYAFAPARAGRHGASTAIRAKDPIRKCQRCVFRARRGSAR